MGIGLVTGILLFNCVKIGSILIGITFGAIVGLMLWAFISYWTASETLRSYLPSLISTGIFAVLGAIFGAMPVHSKKAIAYGTSMIGSYTFMRGWSLIFKGYVGEQKMYGILVHWTPVELEWQMTIYVAILYVAFTASSFYQFFKDEEHEAMLATVKQQGNDLGDI